MKRFIFPVGLIVIIAALLTVIGFILGGKGFSFNPLHKITEQQERSAHSVLKEVLPIGEYASLAYHYTTVVKEINARDIRGWTIPFTTRRYIFTYDGVMKLGIDGTSIRIEEHPANTAGEAANPGGPVNLPVIRIILPSVKILSHEIIDGSIEVFEQSQTIFNEIKIADAFEVTAERKRELEEKVMSGGVPREAQISAEQQLGSLLKNLPGIKEKYDLEFIWDNSGAADR